MEYLLDTCVLSEFVKPKPEQCVVDWLNEQEQNNINISVVTVGEIQRGISLLPQSNRKTKLEDWLSNQLLNRFTGHVLSIDSAIFETWGKLVARLQKEGRPMGVFDSLIAATALHHHLTVVTRNITDFENAQVNVFNPWLPQ